MPMNFNYGTMCKNEHGVFKVLAEPIKGKMTVKYDNGKIALLNVQDELANLRNPIHSGTAMNEEDYYIALGYLSVNSYIQAEIEKKDFEKFQMTYFELSGEVVEDKKEQGVWIINNENKWGQEYRINFPKNLFNLVPNLDFQHKICEKENDNFQCQVNSMKWIKELFSLGFRLGNNHSENIQDNIPEIYKEAFQIGMEVAKEENTPKIQKMMIGTKRKYKTVQIEKVHSNEIARITAETVFKYGT